MPNSTNNFWCVLILFFTLGIRGHAQVSPDDLVDSWHRAAARADFDTYFGTFASDSSIFLGSDATERWNKVEFMAFAKPYFNQGKGWEFLPFDRHWQGDPNSGVLYFHEKLDSKHMGVCRGSGVLIRIDDQWKLDFYNLAILVPNELVSNLLKQIQELPIQPKN